MRNGFFWGEIWGGGGEVGSEDSTVLCLSQRRIGRTLCVEDININVDVCACNWVIVSLSRVMKRNVS